MVAPSSDSPKPAMGRPRLEWFNEEFFATVLALISRGRTLRSIAKEQDFDEGTFRTRVATSLELSTRYALAREQQAEAWSDEIVEVADETSHDSKRREDGSEMPDNEWIARSKLRVDTRKWLMAKLHPKRYGDRLETTATLTLQAGDSISALLDAVRSGAVKQVGPGSGDAVLELPVAEQDSR